MAKKRKNKIAVFIKEKGENSNDSGLTGRQSSYTRADTRQTINSVNSMDRNIVPEKSTLHTGRESIVSQNGYTNFNFLDELDNTQKHDEGFDDMSCIQNNGERNTILSNFLDESQNFEDFRRDSGVDFLGSMNKDGNDFNKQLWDQMDQD